MRYIITALGAERNRKVRKMMEQTNRSCLYCGALFSTSRKNKKFCSPRCCHYYHNRIGKQHKLDNFKETSVIREFLCKRCGKHVYVSDKLDRRTEFCSAQCCRNYWRHREKWHPGDNQGMSGGMSLGTLKRREKWALG